MPWTAGWVNGEVVTHTKLNSMRDDDANWKGNVNAGGFNLSNLGQITGAVMVVNGPISAIHDSYDGITSRGNSSNAISLRIQNTFTGGRFWNLFSSGGGVAPLGCFGIWDDTAGATRLVIDVPGRVGIGTTVPTAKLHVAGLASYANNAAAIAAGLTAGAFYIVTSSNPALVAVVI